MKFGYAWTFVHKTRGERPPQEKRVPALPRRRLAASCRERLPCPSFRARKEYQKLSPGIVPVSSLSSVTPSCKGGFEASKRRAKSTLATATAPHAETVAYFVRPDYCGRAEPPGALGHAVAASKLLP